MHNIITGEIDRGLLEQLGREGESHMVEFKKSLSQLKAAMESLCGFLNTDGGMVILGMGQEGKLLGQMVTDNTQQEIAKELAKIEPFPATVSVQYVALNDSDDKRQIIVVSSPKGTELPYTYDGRAFYRSQSSTRKMSQTRYSQLLLERGAQMNNTWDMQLVDHATVADLDEKEIRRTVQIGVNVNRIAANALDEPIEDILQRLNLMRDNKLTNAAMVLFAKSVMPDFSQCLLKMAVFNGVTDLGDFIDNQMIHGNAFQLMNAANEFIMRHLSVASFFDEHSLERTDKPALPVLAIREALSNAICHRNYAVYNGAITLAIFDDRLEIWNNGILPSDLTLSDLRKTHRSYPRNKSIAWIFYLRHYVETWGTGTTKMINLCREHGLSEPVFTEYSNGFSVVFKFGTAAINHTEPVTAKRLLNARQQEILKIIQHHGSITLLNLKAYLDDSRSTRMIRKDLNILREASLVRLEGHGKNAIWVFIKDE